MNNNERQSGAAADSSTQPIGSTSATLAQNPVLAVSAGELRVSNWVLNEWTDGNPAPMKITGILHDLAGFKGYAIQFGKGQITSIEHDDIEDAGIFAIPLTDEILLKAGFKELNYGWYAKEYFTDCSEAAEVMSIQYNLTTGRCGIGDTDFGGCNAMTGKVFYSLHQLQNLVYSLTGSELEVVW